MSSFYTHSRRATAFTLAEVLISVGILGIGLTMAAALWPAAIRENQNSSYSSLGTIICENAIALAQAKFRIGAVGTKMTVLVDPNNPANAESCYPLGDSNVFASYDPNFHPTFATLARRTNTTDNEVQLVVIAIAPHPPKVRFIQLDWPIVTGSTTITQNDPNFGKVGAPVITSGGQIAIITGVDTTKRQMKLDRPLDAEGGTTTIYTLQEWRTSGGYWSAYSPTMHVMTTRTALRP